VLQARVAWVVVRVASEAPSVVRVAWVVASEAAASEASKEELAVAQT
jgi:hypothetical protein